MKKNEELKNEIIIFIPRNKKIVCCLKLHVNQNIEFKKDALGLYVSFKKGCTGDYRYGFNGQEKVNEIAGIGNHNTALFWEYDTRLGRRWNLDPVVKEAQSSYSCFGNNPIVCTDVNGDDSTLASGTKTWTWTAGEYDTYESIGKRTGVSVENLKKWNGGKDFGKCDILNISDPKLVNSATPNIKISEGIIEIQSYYDAKAGSGCYTAFGQIIGLTFIPNDACDADKYYWFQTFETNAPLHNGCIENDNGYNCSDAKGGYNLATGGSLSKDFKVPYLNSKLEEMGCYKRLANQVGHTDWPKRGFLPNKNVYWNGMVSLIKVVNGEKIIISTFTYGFTLPDNNACKQVSSPLIFKSENSNNEYHKNQILQN